MSNPKSTETIEYVRDFNLFFTGDHLCIDLSFEGPHGIQGIGARSLTNFKTDSHDFTAFWFSKLREIFDLPDEKNFTPLIKGKLCRVIREDGYFISAIGHPVYKEKVLDFKKDLVK
jgi:hypothetical protein